MKYLFPAHCPCTLNSDALLTADFTVPYRVGFSSISANAFFMKMFSSHPAFPFQKYYESENITSL